MDMLGLRLGRNLAESRKVRRFSQQERKWSHQNCEKIILVFG